MIKFSEYLNEAKSANKPFSDAELAQINKVLDGFEAKGRTSISAQALGFAGELQHSDSRVRAAMSSKYEPKSIRYQTVHISQIYAQDQDGVSIQNLRDVLAHWDTTPLPEVLAMSGGKFWLIEGHHRIALQRICGRFDVRVKAEYKRGKGL